MPGYLVPPFKPQIPIPPHSTTRSWRTRVRQRISKLALASAVIRSRFKKGSRRISETIPRDEDEDKNKDNDKSVGEGEDKDGGDGEGEDEDEDEDKDTHREEDTSKILRIPEELLLEIIGHLSPSSLYFLRQTCHKFQRISADRNFDDFNRKFFGPAKKELAVGGASYKQLGMIRDVLARKYHCSHCTHLRDSGILKQKMKDLYEPMYCKGCRHHHPALFFPRIHRHKRSQGGGLCVGHLGKFTLCSHLSFYWSELNAFHSLGSSGITCKNSDHIPQQILSGHSSKAEIFCPRVQGTHHIPSGGINLMAERTLFLLQLDFNSPFSIEDFRQKLVKAIYKLPDDAKLCGHCPSMGRRLLDCVSPSECNCVSLSIPFTCISCLCKNHTVRCSHCGVNYSWEFLPDYFSRATYVLLRIQRDWTGISPQSPELLSSLNYDSYNKSVGHETGNPVFDESTRHVLWCENPGCATGTELRWLRMAKTCLYETSKPNRKRSLMKNSDFAPRWLSMEHDVFIESKQWVRR